MRQFFRWPSALGANTTIFSVINGTLLNSLPYEDSSRIMVLWNVPVNQPEQRQSVTAQQYLAWKNGSKSFSAMGSWYGRPGNLGGDRNTPAALHRYLARSSHWMGTN